MTRNLVGRALKRFTMGAGKSAGRNSQGRITSFHRGGGAKRLQRSIDVKRSTTSMGIVESINYDPNRSSRVALIRWFDGVRPDCQRKCNTVEEFSPAAKIVEPTSATICNQFSFSSMPGKVDHKKVACSSPGLKATDVMVGFPTGMPPSSNSQASTGSKKTCAQDVFLSAFSKGETASLSCGSSFVVPRMAIAGAKPAFFVPRVREKLTEDNTVPLGEVRKWRPDSSIWAHKNKRKAALSWQSLGFNRH